MRSPVLARDAHQALGGRSAPPRASRQTGWRDGSPDRAGPCALAGSPRPRNGRRRGGACARARPPTPSSSSTSSEPVEEPMNTLMPAAAGQPLQLGDVVDILVRAADVEGEVAVHAVPCARRTLSASASARGGQRLGVRHLEHGRDAAQHRGAASRSPGPPCAPGRARGNAPGVSMTPGSTCRPVASTLSPARARGEVADRRDPAAADADVAHARAVVVDHRAALAGSDRRSSAMARVAACLKPDGG